MRKLILVFFSICTIFTTACSRHKKPSDTKAYESVHQLYQFLCDTTSKGIMFGHQDSFSYGIGWKYKDDPGASDIEKVCGQYPAIFGWDLGHIETGSSVNIDSVDFNLMRKQILRVHKMGAINTISWHPTNPITGGSTWDTTHIVVKEILPGGSHEQKFNNWLRSLGHFFNSLKDEEGNYVPIIFRPYHEHTGNWFWWGNSHCSQEEFKKLWQHTASFLKDSVNVHNLLYCYSTDKVHSREEYLDKYPGDDIIDILGIDVYDFPHYGVNYPKVLPECLSVLQKVGKEKQMPIALTETGNLCVQDAKWWTNSLLKHAGGYGIKWFLVWINIEEAQYYGPYPGQMSAENFRDFEKHPETIFAKDLPNIFN